jgi:hypothetical protein
MTATIETILLLLAVLVIVAVVARRLNTAPSSTLCEPSSMFITAGSSDPSIPALYSITTFRCGSSCNTTSYVIRARHFPT